MYWNTHSRSRLADVRRGTLSIVLVGNQIAEYGLHVPGKSVLTPASFCVAGADDGESRSVAARERSKNKQAAAWRAVPVVVALMA